MFLCVVKVELSKYYSLNKNEGEFQKTCTEKKQVGKW